MFSVAVGRMHCACRDERFSEGWGGGGRRGSGMENRKEEVSGAQRSGQS